MTGEHSPQGSGAARGRLEESGHAGTSQHGRARMGPALALIELSSVAIGYLVVDAVVKKAPVRVLRAQTTSPGKYLLLFSGGVAEVECALEAGLAIGDDCVVDHLLLPYVHEQVIPALSGVTAAVPGRSLGVLEAFSLAAAIRAADAAVKTAQITLIEIRLPHGLGGKAFMTLTGEQGELEPALMAGAEACGSDMLLRQVLIPNPHPDLHPFVF